VSALHHLSALEQAAAVRKREVSPVELVEHYLDRIERLDAQLGAYVTVTAEVARAQAAAAERAVKTGDPLPPLHGVPTAIKDLNLTAGIPTQLGSRAYADFVPHIDDTVVELLRAAGLISLGKTNTPEFGLPCYTESDVAPPARTPWDPDRMAGGSSGGAAVAVAAGLTAVAQGSDGGGSIRIPASCCGLVGLKVSRGRVSNGPVLGDITGLAWNGPIARTVRDAAAVLDAMAVRIVDDPTSAWPLAPGENFLGWADRGPARLRIGRYRRPVIADVEVDPVCVAAYERASANLAALGHDVEDTAPPFGTEQVLAFETVWAASAAAVPVDPTRESSLRPLTRWLRERGRATTALDLLAALGQLQLAARGAIRGSAAFDAVLTPTLAQPPLVVGAIAQADDPATDFAAQKRFTPFTAPYNLTGQPAVSLPMYTTATGLPIGIQLVGRPGGEGPLIALAAQLEAAYPWSDRRPSCW